MFFGRHSCFGSPKIQLIVTLLGNPCYCILDSANWHTQLIGTLPILVALIQLIGKCQLSARGLYMPQHPKFRPTKSFAACKVCIHSRFKRVFAFLAKLPRSRAPRVGQGCTESEQMASFNRSNRNGFQNAQADLQWTVWCLGGPVIHRKCRNLGCDHLPLHEITESLLSKNLGQGCRTRSDLKRLHL